MKKSQKFRERKSHSVFSRVLSCMLVLVVTEAVLLSAMIRFSGIVTRLEENADQMLLQQVENRKATLYSRMTSYWSDVRSTVDTVNEAAQRMVDEGSLDLSNMKKQGGEELLLEVMPELLPKIHAKRVSGLFVILNSESLSASDALKSSSERFLGVCVRDLDPSAPYLDATSDLVLERAPSSVVQALGISTTSNWMPMYDYRADSCENFLRPAFQTAYETEGVLSDTDCGYWTMPYTISASQMTCIAYTVPLTLEDGTVYGVLGVEIEDDYLYTLLPEEELVSEGGGSYLLAIRHDSKTLIPVLSNDEELTSQTLLSMNDSRTGLSTFETGGKAYVAAEQKLKLYNSNTPFAEQQWVLIGAVPEAVQYAFSQNIEFLLAVIVLFLLLAGVAVSLVVSRVISNPIHRMAELVGAAEETREGVPEFPKSGLKEIDQFASAIGSLHSNLIEASTRFLNIMDMASVDMGGFEMCRDEDYVFVTENFFQLLGLENDFRGELTVQQFRSLLGEIESQCVPYSTEANEKIYCIPSAAGPSRYVRLQMNQYDDRAVGVVEDVTAVTQERIRIEHERDYDLLTGLYNRRAVSRIINEMFDEAEILGCAALVMIDLDSLKEINDTYGHDLGDQYICRAARCFVDSVPKSTICARLSGDEFYLLFYGYSDRDSIRAHIKTLQDEIKRTQVYLPDGSSLDLSASCGVAWYPDDADSAMTLMRYADFAMYQAKNGKKGCYAEFDREAYAHQDRSARRVQEFREVMENTLVCYHFQPIVSARTGEVCAHEALMRVNMPTLNNPEQLLAIAHREHRLAEVERMTWFKATEAYVKLRDEGRIGAETLLFVNSLASQHLSEEDAQLYCERFSEVQKYMVAEIVEVDYLNKEALRIKRETPGFSGMFALDDYGSGYNSEKNLLELSPKFIKVDTSIIRSIDSDVDKQHIVSSIVDYAHRRNMLIVAEGVETAEELDAVIDLKVDLLQGYFLARPAAIPSPVSPEAVERIKARNAQCE